MFSPETERVIPRQQVYLANILVQVFLILFLGLYFGITFFDLGNLNLRNLLDTYFLLIFIVLFLGPPLVISLFTRWDLRRKWNRLAEDMGLHIEQKSQFASPEIAGTYRGHRISISQMTQRRGRNRVYFTRFTVELIVSSKVTFFIQKRSLTHLNRELTNDEEIDKKLTIKSSSNRLLQQILGTRRLRQGLIELGERARTKNLALQDKTLVYLENNQIRDIEYMRSVLVYLVELSALVERVEQIGL